MTVQNTGPKIQRILARTSLAHLTQLACRLAARWLFSLLSVVGSAVMLSSHSPKSLPAATLRSPSPYFLHAAQRPGFWGLKP